MGREGPERAPKEDLAVILAAKKQLNLCSRATERINGSALREFAKLAPACVVDVRTSHIHANYVRLQSRLKETSAQMHMRAIRNFYAWCTDTKRYRENPAKAVKLRMSALPHPAGVGIIRECSTPTSSN